MTTQKVYNSAAPGTSPQRDERLCRVPKHFHHPKGLAPAALAIVPTHLQCTTNGPAAGSGFHLPDKAQQPSGVVGDPMVWPAREVELSDLSDFVDALAARGRSAREKTQGNRQ